MEGWETLVSKTHGKTYFFHKASGRKQWIKPDELIEADKKLIKLYFTNNVLEMEDDFLKCIRASIYYEFSLDLRLADWFNLVPYSVLDVGCGHSKDFELWKKMECTDYVGMDDNVSTKNILKLDFTAETTWQNLKQKYDVITCTNAIEYACSDKHSFQVLMNGMIKSLTHKGRIIIITPDKQLWKHGGIFNSVNKESNILFGDKFTCSITDNTPMWWFDESMLNEFITGDLKLLPSCNLAKFAAWIGFDSPKISLHRAFEYNLHHRECRKIFNAHLITAEDWRCANFFKVFILTKSNKCGRNYENEINSF